MAQILWTQHDTFQKGSTRGIVLEDGTALTIFGEGGRGGYNVEMEAIPDGAIPVNMEDLPPDVRLAFRTVMVMHGVEDPD